MKCSKCGKDFSCEAAAELCGCDLPPSKLKGVAGGFITTISVDPTSGAGLKIKMGDTIADTKEWKEFVKSAERSNRVNELVWEFVMKRFPNAVDLSKEKKK